DPKIPTIDLLPPAKKAESVDRPEGDPLTLDVEFDKVRRLFIPVGDFDFGAIVEKEKGLANTPGNKLELVVFNRFGSTKNQIAFTGDGKPVPVADLSDDGRWFVHANAG